VDQLNSFGEDACGRLLVVSLAGPVYRLLDGAPSACGSSAPGPPAVAPDTRACVVSTSVRGLRSVRRLKRFTVTLRTDEPCVAEVRARIRGVARFKTVAPRVTPGTRTVARLGLTTRGARAVRRALRRHKTLRVELTVRVRDATGNERTKTRRVRVRG
jgi:hypothetical protein